ncbi:MAG: methyltransferase domain-containing protein [Candidatus Cloacimonetes bacterium]|nr:methyltransferase domain-containing protein [Candidatus Cloacimonadota bacterium]MBS3767334.1 methyltransferase domain-containing protein [Candidatus Cloacimonadota bacterium]
MIGIIAFLIFIGQMFVTNYISYHIMKNRVIDRREWDLNICSGKTDGGALNVDIVKHTELPNFRKINNIYNLSYPDDHFEYVLSSHTIEHVEDPINFFNELCRVGKNVKIIVPPLWDISAAFNILEHKWVFLTFKTEHSTLPPFIKLPFAEKFQKIFGQKIRA